MTFTITIPNELEEEIRKKLKIKSKTPTPSPTPIKKKKVKKLVVNLKGAETINMKKVKRPIYEPYSNKLLGYGKKELVHVSQMDDQKLDDIKDKIDKEKNQPNDTLTFKMYIKKLLVFFDKEKGIYKNSDAIRFTGMLKDIYNQLLKYVSLYNFMIPPELEVKIKKKLKIKN